MAALALSMPMLLPRAVLAQDAPAVSERDYLADLPVVLSVSRLPQRLDETPGAVSVLDRDFIRRSGARNVADLLRLVPGFQTSMSYEADAPQASYHGAFGNYSARIQVLVDGRSVYSTYFFGSVADGLLSVSLEDIERIEVLRGSNSAAYGARAMLGVVNIVTRAPADTQGTRLSLSGGESGIADVGAGLGWRSESGAWRLSVDQQGDDGLLGANGGDKVQRMSLRGDVQLDAHTSAELRLGGTSVDAGRGFATNISSPQRDVAYHSQYLQVDYKRVLDPDEDLALMFAHNQEVYHDQPVYVMPAPYNRVYDNVLLDYSGTASNDSLSVQHTRRFNDAWRVVWGGELRQESVKSAPLYNTDDALITDFTRLFGNAEWRFHPQAVLNLGAMAEHSSRSGDSLAPRLMVNWHVAPGHTLRAGISRAFRPPSLLETNGNERFYAYNRLTGQTQLMAVNVLARGNLVPETLLSRELGYRGDWPTASASLDVRVFNEAITGLSQRQAYSLPLGTALMTSVVSDYFNGDSVAIRGFEAQAQTKPWAGASLGAGLARTWVVHEDKMVDSDVVAYVPDWAYQLFFAQQLGKGWEFSMSHQHSNSMALQGDSSARLSFSRYDWRLARRFRWAGKQAELALTVQNQGSPYQDFKRTFYFTQRAYLSLRLSF
jgi:iron complex outermembrane receptor protein